MFGACFFFVNTLRPRRKAEDFGTPPRGKRIAAEPFISFGDQPIDHFTLRSDCFEELTDTVEFVPRDRRGGVGVFHRWKSLVVQTKIKNGSAFPVDFHLIGSGRINAPHGGTEPYSMGTKNARDDEQNPPISMEVATNVALCVDSAKEIAKNSGCGHPQGRSGCHGRGGVGVFHLVLALNRKTKSGFVFPAAKHQIGLPGH